MAHLGAINKRNRSFTKGLLLSCAAGAGLFFASVPSIPAQTYQSNSPSIVIPNQPGTTGGGYATQARPATQAGQASQATQAQGYKSPYSPQNPYSAQTRGLSTVSPAQSGAATGGAVVDYYSTKGKTGTYEIPSNLLPSKTNPNSVLQGDVKIRSNSNPSLNEDYRFQERVPAGDSTLKSVTGKSTGTSAPKSTAGTTSSTKAGADVSTRAPALKTEAPKKTTAVTTGKTGTSKKTSPASTGNTLITVKPTTKKETVTNTKSETQNTGTSKTSATKKTSSGSSGDTLITVRPATKTETSTSKTETGTAAGKETDNTSKTTRSSKSEDATTKKVVTTDSSVKSTKETKSEDTAVKTESDTAKTSATSTNTTDNTVSDHQRALKKAEKEQLRKAKMEGAATAMQSSKDRAMGLLGTDNTGVAITSDDPRAQIDFNQINKQSAEIGQFLKNGVSMAAVNPGSAAPAEEEPLCAAPEISEELQKQLDEEKRQLKEALRKERERKEKELKKLKADAKADKDVKNRENAKKAEEERKKKFKKLAKKRQKLQEERDRLDAEKEKNQDKYDKARKDEYKARKGPPADPNCRSANCQKHKQAQGKAREALNEVRRGEKKFGDEYRALQTDEREYKEYSDALEEALDAGFGQTTAQKKQRKLLKQQKLMREEQQAKQRRINQLEAKAKGRSTDSLRERQRLKEMTRDLDSVKRQIKAAKDYIKKNAGNGDKLEKILNAHELVKSGEKFVRDQASLENSVGNQDAYGRGLNGGEARELNRLKAENEKYEKYLSDNEKSPAARANAIGEKLAADGIPPLFNHTNPQKRDAEIKALESAVGDLKKAEDRVQHFTGQPDVKAQKEAIAANDKAQKELESLQKQQRKYYDSLPKPYADQSKKIKAAKKLQEKLNLDADSTWNERNAVNEELEKLEKAQARHDRQHIMLSGQSAEKFGDKVAAAAEKAHLTGIKATGAKAQQIVSEYNRELPDVFGADGKVSPAKVNKIAAGIDKQLEDVARVNAELGTLHEIRGNLIPGPNGGKSVAEQAGMSPKGTAKRLKGIDGRIETASGFQRKLQAGLKQQGFNSKVAASGQCTINSVSSAMGAAYVKGARRALERKASEKKIRMAALSGKKGVASPAAKAIAKNAQNAKNVKQAEQAKQFQMGGGQCSGAGGPAASCAGGKAPARGLIMAGRATKEFTRIAGLAVGGIGGAVVAAVNTVSQMSYEDLQRYGKQSQLAAMSSRNSELTKKIAAHNVLLGSVPKGGFQEQVLSQQRFGYITEQEALSPKIAKLKSELEAEDAQSAKKAQLASTNRVETAAANFKKAIGDINGNIEAVELVMASVENAKIPGLLPALEGQRESLFAGRAHLESKLKELKGVSSGKEAGQKEAAATTASAPSKQNLKDARTALENNITALTETSVALEKSGNTTISASLKQHIKALEAAKNAINKSLSPPQSAAVSAPPSQKELMDARTILEKNIKALSDTSEALEKSGNTRVSAALNKQVEALQASKIAIDNKLNPPITVAGSSKQPLTEARTALDKNIKALTATSLALEKSGNAGVAVSLNNQIAALEASRKAIDKELDPSGTEASAPKSEQKPDPDKPATIASSDTVIRDEKIKEIVKVLDANIKNVSVAEQSFKEAGLPGVAQAFSNQRIALQTVREQYLPQIKAAPIGPKPPARVQTAAYDPKTQRPIAGKKPEEAELEHTKDLVGWINNGLLPAFKNDSFAKNVLPNLLVQLISEFGAKTADEILDSVADYVEDLGVEPSGAIFVDELLKRINDENRSKKTATQNLTADRIRTHFLREALQNKNKQLSKDQIVILKDSLEDIKKRLVKQISGELKGLDNKPVELLDKLSILAELASLVPSSPTDLKPLLEQISRQLARIEKTGRITTDNNAADTVASLKNTLTTLQKSLSGADSSAPRSAEISKLLERINNQLAGAYSNQAQKAGVKSGSPKVARARLDQARHAMRGGDFKKALDLIKGVTGNSNSIKLAKAVALVDTLNNYERVYAMLTPKMQQSVGKLEDVLKQRDQAIADILKISTNPKLIAALLTGNAERLRLKGKYVEALDAIETALSKNPGDEVLLGTKVKLEILLLRKDLSAENIIELLNEVPKDKRVASGLLALNNLTSEGSDAAAKALLKVLRDLKEVPADQKQRFEVQLDYSEISLLAGKLGLGGDDKELVKKLERFKAKVLNTKGLDEIYQKAMVKASEHLLEQLYKARKWAVNYKSGNIPLDQLKQLIRDAMAAGRYDIAGPAMVQHMNRLFKERGPKDIISGFRQSARFLDSVRLRLAAGGLTEAQAKVFKDFLKTHGGAIEKKIDAYMKERVKSAGDVARIGGSKGTGYNIASLRGEMRFLAQMKIRLALLNTPTDKRVKKIEELRSAANQDVKKYEAQILEDFDERGLLLRDHERDKGLLLGAIAEFNQFRAIRDGIDDYLYQNGRTFSSLGNEGLNPGYGTFDPKNQREQAIKGIHKELAGLNDNAPAGDIWFKRSRFGMTYGRGLREKVLSNHKNNPSDRDYEGNKEKYKNFWLTLMLDDAKLAYKDARRAELINEDPTRSNPDRAKLYQYFLKAEAKYLKQLVSSSNAFLEMFEKLANTGRLMRGAAKQLEGQIALNDHKQLLNEYQAAHLDQDAQRLFRALVPLRDASLAGELKAFVNYLHKDWYEAGPARAYNLAVGMKVTQAALEQITAESQKIQIALIRAGNNLPAQLTELDRKILRRHGFLRDGKYVIPDQIKLDPTKIGTEFVDLTEKGPLATVDRFLNAKQGAELFATVALPGGLAGKFGRAVSMEMLALGGVRTLTGKALAYGTGLVVEAGAFTALNRGARIGLDPSLALQEGFWSRETLIKEYAHNLLIIGALKGFGKTAERIALRAKGLGSTAAKAESYARSVKYVALMGEAKLLTDLNGMLTSNQIGQDEFLGNLLTILLLKGSNKALEGGKKSASTRLQEARINKILSYMGKAPVPGTGPTTKVSQLRDSQIKELEYGEWLRNVDKPTKILLEKYNGNWDAARKDYQKGNLSAVDMRKLILLRKDIVDSLANEIVKELGGEVQAFGSENLTSDYDISFVGPKAQLAVIIFNARFAGRWGKAARLGGRETGVVLDTNAYTETIQSLIKAGRGDTTFQDAFSHLAARKYLSNKAWAKHRKWILENTPAKDRASVEKVLDFVESANREYKNEIQKKMAELGTDSETPIRESDLQITAENRLYEGALKDILNLRAKFEKATGVAKEALRQQLRNAQSRALYFAQEAYHTQAAIEHVVMSLQAAGRKITVESLTSDTPPKLKVDLTTDQGRQSYFEQIANMMKEISHKGDPAKLASKGAKYFIRALDAAQIAGLKLAEYKDLIEQVVSLDANRADLAKVREALAKKLIAAAEKAKGVKLNAAERKAIEDQAAQTFLENIQQLSNQLTAKLYDGKSLRVVDNSGVRRLQIKTEAMNARDIINNIDKPTQILLAKFKGDWNAARKAYQTGKLPAADMRLLVNLRKRVVDSLAAEIIRELGGDVEAFGSENLTSDYDISFVGPKAQLAVILFNARFASGWGQASKIGGRETGVVLDTNAYTETIQSLIKAGKGDVTFQDAFAHLAGRKYLSPEAWSKHREWILGKTPEANKADVKKVLDWVEVANKEYRADIEAKKRELMNDPEVKIREADLQITAENRLYEAALKDIIELRETFDKATGKEKEALRLKLRNAQSKALYFAQEAYHTQGAIEHVVMSIQAAGRKITAQSLLSDKPPKLAVELTAEQGRQSYFEQIANMMKEISHAGDTAKLASKGAKYFVRALDAAQIAGLKLAGLREVVELTVDLNNNRADLGKVRDILAKDALATARKQKGTELTKEEKAVITEKAGRDYLEAVQKASNLLTAELYSGKKVKVVDVDGIPKLELQLPEPANDNKPFVSREQAEAQSLQRAAELAGEKVDGAVLRGEMRVGSSSPKSKAEPIGDYAAQREIKVVTRDQQTLTFILGEKLGKGATSYAYRHLGPGKFAIRITKKGDWDAIQLDIFGRKVLETKVNTAFVRIVKRYKLFQIAENGTRFFQAKKARTIEVNELMEQGTAEDIMARQKGMLTDGQRIALDQGIRELNRKGYAWLDNKPDNYTFERTHEGKDIWRLVVIDPGAIVPMRGQSPYARYKNARELQARINQQTPDIQELLDTQKGARKFVLMDIRQKINEHHKDKINVDVLQVPFNEIAYSPHGMLKLRQAQKLFALTPEAANENYENFIKKALAAGE